jgi:hypothetical protein
VQKQVHHAEAGDGVDDVDPSQGVEAEMPLLVRIEVGVVARDVLVRGEQEAAGAARRIADRHARLRAHHLDDRLDQRARREVLARPRLHVFRVLLEQPLVGIALYVRVERHPALPVDQVDDQPAQLRRILNAVLRLAEHDAEHARTAAELGQEVAVVHLELVAGG